ncbi:SDR family oxidoreductase [Sphaerisporangium album]|uniref:SDR family oxidoreductase n=1 Tax=Sphaerisporangium album TaxID=509200 RepID=UPI001FE6307B|nr:SDR family oxidoreductase [Sphaerisporangium album]
MFRAIGDRTPGNKKKSLESAIRRTGHKAGRAEKGAPKAAATVFTKTLGLEVAAYGIRCNVLTPGSTDTPMLSALWSDHERALQASIEGSPGVYRTGIPLGKVARPADIAEAVAFLLSSKANHITLQHLTVDGGATLGIRTFVFTH